MMFTAIRRLTEFLLIVGTIMPAGAPAFDAGTVYGPTSAFTIEAPTKWVLDDESGVSQGLHCVLYPAGSSWSDSPVAMYAKIASPEFRSHEGFAQWAIRKLRKEEVGFHFKRIRTGMTQYGHPYFVNEYREPRRPRFERVAYIQLPDAVAVVVYTARTKSAFKADRERLDDVLRSFRYTPERSLRYTPELKRRQSGSRRDSAPERARR